MVVKKSSDNPVTKQEIAFFDAMDDPVRVIDGSGSILFENASMIRFCSKSQEYQPSSEIFPLNTSSDCFTEGRTSVIELCVFGHVFSVKSSPVFENDKVIACIEVFRDITIQNNLTVSLYGANQKIKREMIMARSIQKSMLPDLREFNNLSFDSRYVPSEDLSGDFFDLIPLGKNRIAIYISDVVGHGVSASILTMFVRQTMRSILEEIKTTKPSVVLPALKKRFNEINLADDQYFSLFYGVFDTKEGTFTYANAGHNCEPVLFNTKRTTLLTLSGMLISKVQQLVEYEQNTVWLEEGDRILFLTDGLVDTTDMDGNPYGMENLGRVLLQAKGNILESIIDDVNCYRYGSQRDDIALLLATVQGKK